jgi:hypothetical protein
MYECTIYIWLKLMNNLYILGNTRTIREQGIVPQLDHISSSFFRKEDILSIKQYILPCYKLNSKEKENYN